MLRAGRIPRRAADHLRAAALDNRLVAAGSMVGATLFLLPFSLAALVRREHARRRPAPVVGGDMLGLGMVCTAIAYVLYFRG